MKSILFFPPGWMPFSPYLALPLLKGYLETKGIEVNIIDGNVEFFDYILSEDFINKCYESCNVRLKSESKKLQKINLQRTYKSILLENTSKYISNAKNIIRNSSENADEEVKVAEQIINNAFYIINTFLEDIEINFKSLKILNISKNTDEVIKYINSRNASNSILIEYFEKYKKIIEENNIRFVGMSITSQEQLIPALLFAKLIKTINFKNIHICFGGNYITRIAKNFKDYHPFYSYVDSIILYEGEYALEELIHSLSADSDLSKVPNLVYLEGDKLKKNEIKQIKINDLSSPNFDGFPLNKYFSSELVLPIYSSRNCFNKCAFCTIADGNYGDYKQLNIEDVYKNMIELSSKYKTKYFTFVDETFEIKRMKYLADKIYTNNKEFVWYAETRFTTYLTENIAKDLYNGGCRKIQFGLESYNQHILDLMRKNIRIDWIEKNLVNCFKAKIPVHLFFMIGFPTESKSESKKTIDFANYMLDISKNKYDLYGSTIGFGPFSLEKGSYVWKHPDKYKIQIIKNNYNDLDLGEDYISLEGMSQSKSQEVNLVESRNYNDILKDNGIINFFDHQYNNKSEEEIFISISKSSKFKNTPKKYKLKINLNKVDPSLEIFINSDSKFITINYDIFKSKSVNENYIYGYNILDNIIYKFNESCCKVLDYLHKYKSINLKELNNKDFYIIEDLLYYNFLHTKEIQFVNNYEKNNFILNKNITSINYSNGIAVFNENNGSLITMNEFSYNLLENFRNPISYKEFSEKIKKTYKSNNINVINEYIDLLIENQIIFITM